MLFKTLKRMIDRNNTIGLAEKIDVLYACGRLTKEEYVELNKMLNNN